jgi:hypothetical protein
MKLIDLSEAASHVVVVSGADCQLSFSPVWGDCRWTSGAASAVAKNILMRMPVYMLVDRSEFRVKVLMRFAVAGSTPAIVWFVN